MTLFPTFGGRRPLYLLFMAVLGLAGWGTLAAGYQVPEFGPSIANKPEVLPFALFLLVIVAARSMAFSLLPKTVVSLDSAFYVAATVCLGSVTAGLLVAIALTLDSFLRLVGTEAKLSRPRRDWIESLTYVVYFGGMSGSLLMVSAWIFAVDAVAIGARADQLAVLGKVIGVGVTLLVAHYSLQGVRLQLLGQSFSDFVRRITLPGLVAEASLLPLAAVVVFIYHPDRPLGFALLGATYLIINFAFSRLTRMSAQLRQRVSELETLNVTSRRLAASLQLHELVEVVARETLRAIPEAEVLTLSRREEDNASKLVVDYYDRDKSRFHRIRVRVETGAAGRVLEHGEPMVIPDLARSELAAASGETRGAWLGVPIVIYGEVEGVLAIQSRKKSAFAPDHMRLLESIGAQAAVALQNARLYELAMIDGLTGLFVRRYLDARLVEEVQRSRRYGTAFSLVMMDIDNFKELNDTYGHQAGDEVLRGIATIVKREMRAVDTAARYGGEEIAMILPRTGMVDAYNLAERVRVEIGDHRVAVDAERVIGVTSSFGIASFPDSGAEDVDALIALADRALYRAKKTGKNRVELYWSDDGNGDGAGEPGLRTVS